MKRVIVDGATALDKVKQGACTEADMSGAEFFAIVGHLKENHSGGQALETDLLKVKRQVDKRRALVQWVGEQFGAAKAPVPKLNVAPPTNEQRPNTARGDFAAPQAARPMPEAPPYAPQTARPSTAQSVAVKDMTPSLNTFAAGKEHVQMTGGEYHGIVAWLKGNGHPEVEDQLMRVKLLGDKKYQLCKYLKENFPHGAAPAPPPTTAPATPPQLAAPQAQPEVWVNEQAAAPPLQQPRFEPEMVESYTQPVPQQLAQPPADPRAAACQNLLALEQVKGSPCPSGLSCAPTWPDPWRIPTSPLPAKSATTPSFPLQLLVAPFRPSILLSPHHLPSLGRLCSAWKSHLHLPSSACRMTWPLQRSRFASLSLQCGAEDVHDPNRHGAQSSMLERSRSLEREGLVEQVVP